MPTVVLRPNATLVAADSVTGAATDHAALSDDLDTTFVTVADPAKTYMVGLTTSTIPAGGLVRTVRARCRALAVTTTERPRLGIRVGPTTIQPLSLGDGVGFTVWTQINGSTVAASLSQSEVDALRIIYGTTLDDAGIKYSEMYLDLMYATQPTVVVNAPDGTITGTNRPVVEWTHTPGTDGGPQTRFEVKVFTAAQVAAGGFSVDTTEPVSQSGLGPSDVPEWDGVAPLVDGSYVVYVRTAQLGGVGTPHWSEWASETFSIDVDTSDVDAVIPAPDNNTASITVSVTRASASEAWDAVEVHRQVAGGEWVPVRGANGVDSTGNADIFMVVDHEAPNGTNVVYRARATRIVGGLPITGEWVQSAAVQWVSETAWLKDPTNSTLNMPIRIRELSMTDTPIRQGVFDVLGRRRPVITSDTRLSDRGTFMVQTETMADARSLVALLDSPFLLLQFPDDWDVVSSRYVSVGPVGRAQIDPTVVVQVRRFPVGFHEIDAPNDPTARTGLP